MSVKSLGISVRHALHKARRLTTGLAPTGRRPSVVGMAASALVVAVPSPQPKPAGSRPEPNAEKADL